MAGNKVIDLAMNASGPGYKLINLEGGGVPVPPPGPDYSKEYLTIEALSGGTFYVRNSNINYSVNGAAWETTAGETALALNSGDKVIFKGTGASVLGRGGGNGLFSGNTLAFNAYGNIESLEYGDNFEEQTNIKTICAFTATFKSTGIRNAENLILPATTLKNNCYQNMFQNCTTLSTPPALPATTLATSCYQSMFNNCTSLTTAPALPATTLVNLCYSSMFQGCTSLTKAPDLPAPTLVDSCYSSMFQGCTSLDYIKCLATDISASSCTGAWVYRVKSTGTFVKNPNMTSWTTGISGIPKGWTVIEE